MLEPATLLCALGCGLIAGAFFAFSTFVMKALGKLPTAQGIAAMQSINLAVINPWFMAAFMGTALLCVIVAALGWNAPAASYLFGGGVLYVAGTFGVTMACNVPRNNALAAVDPASAQAETLWRDYLSSWTFWNHVRTIAALGASALFILALGSRPWPPA
ncbi:MAG TPA: anthrone oxygenase family protein [Burkholderiales bacterium]